MGLWRRSGGWTSRSGGAADGAGSSRSTLHNDLHASVGGQSDHLVRAGLGVRPRLVAEEGEIRDIDTTSLASLCAGCVAATAGLARLVGENDFPVHFHQGRRASLHVTRVTPQMILAVVFDDRSSLGLVRLRVRKAVGGLARIFETVRKKAERPRAFGNSPFADITDEDIDNLFSN